MFAIESQRALRLVSSAMIFGGAVLGSGCQTPEEDFKVPKLQETLAVPQNVYPFLKDQFTDPIYRAASLTIFTKDGSYGHGSLVRKEGKLYVYTIAHIADALILNGESYVNIPGLENSVRKLDPKNFKYHPKKIEYEDQVVSYEINSIVQREVEGSVKKGQINPLIIDQDSLDLPISVVSPRGDIGKNTFLRVIGKTQSGALDLQADNMGVICSGRSGGAILRVINGQMSNRLVGILSAGEVKSVMKDPQGLRSPCFGKVVATPIN